VTGNYFQQRAFQSIRGRDFTRADTRTRPCYHHIALSEHYCRADPIGKRLHRARRGDDAALAHVAGEIGDVRDRAADFPAMKPGLYPGQPSQSRRWIFRVAHHAGRHTGSSCCAATNAPEQMSDALRSVVRSIDPQLPLTNVESMDRVVSEGQASRRFNTALISSFAAAAVLLSLLGIYSVIASRAAAHAGDGDSSSSRFAALTCDAAHRGFRREARLIRMRHRRSCSDLRHALCAPCF